MSRISPVRILIAALLLSQTGRSDDGHPPTGRTNLQRFEFVRLEMGTSVRVVVYASERALANEAARTAYARIRQLSAVFSDYDPNSELMRLCRESQPGHPVPVSEPLYHVLEHSRKLSAKTGGAFDVTVGPLTELWRKTRRRGRLPGPDELAQALDRVGHSKVRLHGETPSVELLQEGMRLDLGGVAKGYIADEALRSLRESGINRALIDAGGDIVLGDAPPGKDGWRVGVARLEDPAGTPSRFLLLQNAAVATSGDAVRFVEIDGTRYSHIVDPKTGLGLTTPMSVTVVAPGGLEADSLASAVCVLGTERGLALIDETGATEALVVVREDQNVRTVVSRGFERLTAPSAADTQ